MAGSIDEAGLVYSADSDAGLPREKVLATVVYLLEKTMIRVGNAEYARANRSFGLTALGRRHVRIDGGELRFRFRGKSGRQWNLRLQDRRVARIVWQCQDLPGQHLFEYEDGEGQIRAVTSEDVNLYLREIARIDARHAPVHITRKPEAYLHPSHHGLFKNVQLAAGQLVSFLRLLWRRDCRGARFDVR
ncbi:hypothetical protein [Novosphingobium sp. UBA1939]|uniref:hypothetical protein n=1 Tax=Novosphingobium sp. UBA1939 TaxID=1946982 RepID=UPI0025F12100|nr:hypothetical protein [Novosphingobium sp. UBA1939]